MQIRERYAGRFDVKNKKAERILSCNTQESSFAGILYRKGGFLNVWDLRKERTIVAHHSQMIFILEATAFASMVLHVPGGSTSKMPLGICITCYAL